jgi:PAS domain S-box-containing protein
VTRKVKILIVEDNPVDIELMHYELKKGGIDFVSATVQGEEEYRDALKDFIPDIILSDYALPVFDGPTAFKIKEELAPDTPFIFVSGYIGDEKSIEYIKNGVTDYALKDKLFTLAIKVKRALKEAKQKQQKDKIEKTIKDERILLRTLIDNLPVIVYTKDVHSKKTLSNRADYEFIGARSEEEVLGKDDADFFPAHQAQLTMLEDQQIFTTGHPIHNKEEIRRNKDDSTTWFLKSKIPLKNQENEIVGLVGISYDITERKETEEKINKVNRLYSFISHINKTISHVNNEQTLFDEACKIAVEQGKFEMAWIGMADTAQRKIKLVAGCGISASDIELLADKTYDIDGPTEKVLKSGEYYAVNNIQDEKKLSWKKYARERGFNSSISLAIKKSGKVIGTFDVYSSETGFFDQEEIRMLEEVTADITFGLEILENARIQKDTEERVVQNEKRFRSLIEKGADLISLGSPEGKIFYVSPSIPALLDYTLAEVLKINVYDFIHPEDMPGLMEQTESLLKVPGSSIFRQQRYRHKSGKWIWCEGTITNMLNEPGINALASNFSDISEKKITEQQQEFDRNNLNALINNTNDSMWSVDRDFKLITFNHPFGESIRLMSGVTITNGNNILEAGYSPKRLNCYKESYERAFGGESFTEIECADSPVEFWSEISYYPIRKGDEVIGTACYSRDITQLKLAELERIKISNDLILRNKDLEQFAYIISHNLRAPVANIKGIAEAINSMQLDEQKEKQMKGYLITSVKKLDEVIVDLNEILQIKGNVSEKKETVRFSQLLSDIQISIDSLIRKEEVNFITDFSDVDEMQTLKSYLYSIFYNLISNSIKYRCPDISPAIEIRSKNPKNKIELIFKDNGLGIDLKKRGGQVFGLYKRFHSHTEGKGMGLYMVKAQVETLGGKISVESEVNKGTEFRIEFENEWKAM